MSQRYTEAGDDNGPNLRPKQDRRTQGGTWHGPERRGYGTGGRTPLERRTPPRWGGPLPVACDLCKNQSCNVPADGFIDGRTVFGSWAIMGANCHRLYGAGLGLGKGQRYDATGVKVEG